LTIIDSMLCMGEEDVKLGPKIAAAMEEGEGTEIEDLVEEASKLSQTAKGTAQATGSRSAARKKAKGRGLKATPDSDGLAPGSTSPALLSHPVYIRIKSAPDSMSAVGHVGSFRRSLSSRSGSRRSACRARAIASRLPGMLLTFRSRGAPQDRQLRPEPAPPAGTRKRLSQARHSSRSMADGPVDSGSAVIHVVLPIRRDPAGTAEPGRLQVVPVSQRPNPGIPVAAPFRSLREREIRAIADADVIADSAPTGTHPAGPRHLSSNFAQPEWISDCMAGRSREARTTAQKTMIAVRLWESVIATAPTA
jgi:hypothetical protein